LLKIAICDDEVEVLHTFSSRIKAAFSALELNVSVEAFSSVSFLVKQMENISFDVLFLDIEMPEMDGVDFGVSLRALGSEACIIFISNREERVYDTFKVDPVRFIRKSRFHEEIDEAAKAILFWWEKRKNRFLVIPSQGQINTFLIDDIIYVECFNKVQSIVTRTQSKTIRATLRELEDKLLDHGFICPHKGYLVNYKFIDSIESIGIILRNGKMIPVSKYKIAETKKAFLKLVSAEPDISKPRLYKS